MKLFTRKWAVRLAVVSTAALLLAGSALLVHRIRVKNGYQRLKEDGIAASQSGDHKKAVDHLVLYIQDHNDDCDAIRAYVHSRPWVNTSSGYRQAIDDTIFALRYLITLEPNQINDQRLMLDLQLELRNYAEATYAADAILAKCPDDHDALSGKMIALMGQEKWSDALPVAQHWVDIAPLDVEPQAYVLVVLTKTGSRDAAMTRAMTLRAAHPGDARYEYLEGAALRITEQRAEPVSSKISAASRDTRSAAEWFRLAATHAPADAGFIRALVHQLDACGLFEDSQQLLEKAAKEGNVPAIRGDLAARWWQTGKWQQIVELLKDVDPSAAQTDNQTRGIAAMALARVGRESDAHRFDDALKSRPDDIVAQGWIAGYEYFVHPELKEAQAVVAADANALLREPGNAILHFLRGQAFLACGSSSRAALEFETAAQYSPSWSMASINAAELHLQRGEIDDALRACDVAWKSASHDGKQLDIPTAVAIAKVWNSAVDSGRALDRSALMSMVSTIQKAQPGEPESLCIQVARLADGGENDKAKAILAEFVANPAPRNPNLSLRLAQISHSHKLDCESALFDRLDRDLGPTPQVATARAMHLLAAGDSAGGLNVIRSARQKSKDSNSSAWSLAEASYLEQIGDASAVATWIALGDAFPADLNIQQAALVVHAAKADRGFFDRTVARLKDLTGEHGVAWRLAKAQQMLSDGTDKTAAEKAAALLNAVLRDMPTCAPAHRLLAICSQRAGDSDTALKHLLIAADLSPTDPSIVMDLVTMLNERSSYSDSRSHLQKLVDSPSATPEALAMMGWLRERDGQLSYAEQYYRRALAMRPSFAVVQNNLAMLLTRQRSPAALQEAIQLATDAAKANPSTASYWGTLAIAQSLAGDSEKALATYDRAIALAPCDLSLVAGRIGALIAAGHRDQAAAEFKHFKTTVASTNAGGPLQQQLRDLQMQLAN